MKHSIIPLFIPHYGCPHQCIFCNQVRITGCHTPVTADKVRETIDTWLASSADPRAWEAAYYGGSFTALPQDVMKKLLEPAAEALNGNRISSIRLSTRPDCITPDVLQVLKEYHVKTVELGVQSLDDEVLKKAERGHTAADAENAVQLLRKAGFQVGLQFMVGLPGEDMASLRHTARKGVFLRPDFIRLYPVLVLRDTLLGDWYRRGSYDALSLEKAVFQCAFLKNWYEHHGITVIRTGLQATDELDQGDSVLAGPYHSAFGELVDQYIAKRILIKALASFPRQPVTLWCNRKDRSKIMGHQKKTWALLEKLWPQDIQCRENDGLPVGKVQLCVENGIQTKAIQIDSSNSK